MERITYDQMKSNGIDHLTMNVHLQAYAFAHQFLLDKTVIDAACGTCFGSMIYSTAAKSIIAVDKSEEAINHGKRLPSFCPIDYLVRNLDRELLPEADLCISVETIEHLNGDGFFLKNLNVKQLVFTIPIGEAGGYHKIEFNTTDKAVSHLMDNGWQKITAVLRKIQSAAIFPEGNGAVVHDMLMGIAERK
jgi:hypothetical protein